MSENRYRTFPDGWLWNRIKVTSRYGFVAELYVALCTDKRRTLVSLIDFVVEDSTIVDRRCNMATFGATA